MSQYQYTKFDFNPNCCCWVIMFTSYFECDQIKPCPPPPPPLTIVHNSIKFNKINKINHHVFVSTDIFMPCMKKGQLKILTFHPVTTLIFMTWAPTHYGAYMYQASSTSINPSCCCRFIRFTSYFEFKQLKPHPFTNMYSVKFNIHHVSAIHRHLHATC